MIGAEEIPELQEKVSILDAKYQILYTIGEGRYAKVKLGIDMETKKKVAIKIMREQSIIDESSLELFINEVKILSQLQSVCLHGKYTKCDGREFDVLYYVMKIAENGELFKFLMHTPKFDEDIARFFFKQILESIEYLHDKGISHRDIKPENILINRKLKIKLCDFGFAARCRNDQRQLILFDPSDPVGSPEYNPPEVTQNQFSGIKYNAESIDIFQSACVLFMMVMSSAPFGNTSTSDRYYSRFCMENKTHFWKIFAYNNKPSDEFKDLIHCMLVADPQKRYTIQQIKMHPWMNAPIPSLESVREQMEERIYIVFNKTLEELRQKIENKGVSKKEKPHKRKINNIEGLKNKYHKQIQDMNQQIIRKIQNVKKQKILLKQAQPDQKENIPHPLEECLLKQNEDYVIEFQDYPPCSQQSPQLNNYNNGIDSVAGSLLYSPLHFSTQPCTENKPSYLSLKNKPIITKSISGSLEESKTDSKPAHVEDEEGGEGQQEGEGQYEVAPVKKFSWQSKDDTFFSIPSHQQNNVNSGTKQPNQKIAAVQFNDDLHLIGYSQLEDKNNCLARSTHPLPYASKREMQLNKKPLVNEVVGRCQKSQSHNNPSQSAHQNNNDNNNLTNSNEQLPASNVPHSIINSIRSTQKSTLQQQFQNLEPKQTSDSKSSKNNCQQKQNHHQSSFAS